MGSYEPPRNLDRKASAIAKNERRFSELSKPYPSFRIKNTGFDILFEKESVQVDEILGHGDLLKLRE